MRRNFLTSKRLQTAWRIARKSPIALVRLLANRFWWPAASHWTRAFWMSDLRAVAHASKRDRPCVLILATCDYHFPYRQRCQHLANALAGLGHTVFYGSPMTGYDTVIGFERVDERIYVAGYRSRWCDFLPDDLIVLIMSTDNRIDENALGDLRELGGTIIYDYIDRIDPRISLGAIPQGRLRAHDAILRDEAIHTVSVARSLYDEVLAHRTRNVKLVPNGVDFERFQVSRDRQSLRDPIRKIVEQGRPIVGYFGALATWLDYQLVLDVARSRPELNFVMIGPDFDGSRAVWMKSIETIPFNLHFLPPIDYEHLPQNAIWFDVGIIPFVNNEITVATSPLKLYEYFALGLPVVSSPVPDCMNYSDIVEIADNADSFGTAIDNALAMRSDSCFVSRLRECAAQNDWRSRAHSILRSICDADVE